ncbi:MAG TPA: hypothetical protein PKY82_19530 [Pyrinomonadaceae bacterium]|nr:hypothetical protein [Pyrinomonadaceae bacterium]
MKNRNYLILAMFFVLVSSSISNAQTWNSNAGGYNGGYGQVYQTFGLAQATINMQQNTQMQIQQLMMQQAMEKKWGKEAVRKAQNSGSSSNSNTTGNQAVTPKTPLKNYAYFQPIAQNNNFQIIADTIGTTTQEKDLLKQIFTATKNGFDEQVKFKGRKYNFAASMTFFIATTLTVYHDAPEPTDEATENLFQALSQMIDQTPNMANVPNKDKQFLHDTFVSFSGLVLAGYMQAKQTNDKEMLKQYQQVAGGLLNEILKMNPDKAHFEGNTLKFEK